MDDGCSQGEYIRQILEAYRKTPGTAGTIHRPDRVLAEQLYQRGVSAPPDASCRLSSVRHDSFAGVFPPSD